MGTESTIVVRAQAVGGKFLGKGVAATPAPTLTVYQSGLVKATATFTTGNSGVVVTAQNAATTPYPIVVQKPFPPIDFSKTYVPGTYYLEPSENPPPDSYATVTLDLAQIEVAYDFEVTAYSSDLPGRDSVVRVVSTVNLSTSTDLNVPIVVPIPGLRITSLAATTAGVTVDIAMMCGCQITQTELPPPAPQPAEPYWPAYEFQASVDIDGPTSVKGAPLVCVGPSTFQTQGVILAPGDYVLTVNAYQPPPGAGNINKVRAKVSVSAPTP